MRLRQPRITPLTANERSPEQTAVLAPFEARGLWLRFEGPQ